MERGGPGLNALEIIEKVREHDADLVLQGEKLIVQGSGERLPDDLRAELRMHKTEIMVALGAPIDRGVKEILGELRPNLTPELRNLPDDKLLVLVNWTIIAAWEKTIRRLGHDRVS